MPKKYTDKNLIKYEDTIQLHFDESGTTAWLTLKNYGSVFNKKSPDEVTEAIVGTKTNNEFRRTISIGAMLDVADVINFQAYMSAFIGPTPFRRLDLYKKIVDAFKSKALSVEIPPVATELGYKAGDPAFWFTTYRNLSLLLMRRRQFWLVPPKEKYHGLTIRDAIRKYKHLGFTGYFPKPSLILQEERTKEGAERPFPKTDNCDSRAIQPIRCSGMAVPPKVAGLEFLDKLDDDAVKERYGKDNPLLLEKDRDRAEVRAKFEELKKQPKGEPGWLHCHFQRLNCFAFRGDFRDLQGVADAEGFLAGVTRTDPGAFYNKDGKPLNCSVKFKDDQGKTFDINLKQLASEIDAAVTPPLGPPLQKEMQSSKYLDEYLDILRTYKLLHLGEYIKTQEFRGYISTTISVAIAKRFANWYSDTTECTSYCYAVRCRGGFILPSHIEGNWKGFTYSAEHLPKKHEFLCFSEQEVAVLGGIGWHDVVGLRVVRCDEKGQFMSGPIFLQDWLRQEHLDGVKREKGKYIEVKTKEDGREVTIKRLRYFPTPDDAAFGALFELFSGKSQGPSKPGEILKSYPIPPFGS